ncbi:[FeFe] hydrogenase H-cluster radical SAM maturase HydE [Bacteroides caecigallinarum]|uniref:[FeFe] hydrogenase H-cluster radical SAM maturase HydE n=1 Tax=Bacteroides caecigallinarum TaxID=1411144 RepID=UPI001F1BF522|nr:[FeFe] hydrogenase H-cluster radical SAM maturase HydE [Bacteroides caecigallinarum]MCF2551458.1 [FeFe] hydrogenase H-cluster radical SAM maturase HydE [Bacteroides caecigallinarum]
MRKLIERLHREKTLSSDEFRILLDDCDDDSLELINSIARSETQKVFGNRIFVRGLIEVGNCCHNDCLYCGIRRSNRNVERYRLDKETILHCCDEGYRLGFRTFVLQGGEDNYMTEERISDIVSSIRREYPDAAITLSLGEKSYEAYKMFYKAGANRYLLRHETHNPYHYSLLHPETMSLQNRLQCLKNLKEIGYQTGTGIMVGSPGQTTDNIIEDILFIGEFKPQMIGIGPFIPHRDTPFADKSAGSIRTTLLLLSIFRLMHPHALIPSTTALASLATDGRERGILAGANVVMPNLSPPQERSKYSLYNNKASMGAEAAEGLAFLEQKLSAIGYTIDYGRGDYAE